MIGRRRFIGGAVVLAAGAAVAAGPGRALVTGDGTAEAAAGADATTSASTTPSTAAATLCLAISAEAATAFCEWLTSATTGWAFRLPTEAEWENAARGNDYPECPWGDDDTQYSGGVLTSRYNYNGVAAAYALANFKTATYTDRSGLAGESVELASIPPAATPRSGSAWPPPRKPER